MDSPRPGLGRTTPLDQPPSRATPALDSRPPPRTTPSLEPAPSPRSAIPAAPPGRGGSLALDADARRTSQTSASMANIDAQHQRARAATVMQASGGSAGNAIAYLRGNPIMAIGALALLFGLGFGIYVYLQIANPGMFIRQAATRPQDSAPPPPIAAAQPPAPDTTSAAASAPSMAEPTMAASAAGATSATPGGAAPVSGSVAAAPALAPPGSGAGMSSGTGAISTSSVIAGPRGAEPARESMAEAGRGSIRPTPEGAKPAAAPAPAPLAAVPAPAQQPRERIAVTSATAQPRLNPSLSQAYTALQAGNTEEARGLYSKVAQSEPLNIDALLGLAYIAAQENRTDEAVRFYVRILQLNPRHGSAQAALIGLMGRADAVASESRLKQLISREPSAFLHFVLGNLYADQSLWAQAQQSYFQAHHLEPDNADYAYNLAVGLDHLRQSKVALNYYRRAEQLAAASGRPNFNLAFARERIAALSSQLE
jgi:Tfp pilus assembly protein PilF